MHPEGLLYYFALGPADVIVIYEAPDAITAASVSMTLGASGAASSVETMQLFTMGGGDNGNDKSRSGPEELQAANGCLA